MPLEIKELHIKVSIDEGQAPMDSMGNDAENTGGSEEALLQRCVEKVLEILQEKSER